MKEEILAKTTPLGGKPGRSQPEQAFLSLHGAACHNCLFLPETSCERGNRYLDRTVLVPTMERAEFAFFRS